MRARPSPQPTPTTTAPERAKRLLLAFEIIARAYARELAEAEHTQQAQPAQPVTTTQPSETQQ